MPPDALPVCRRPSPRREGGACEAPRARLAEGGANLEMEKPALPSHRAPGHDVCPAAQFGVPVSSKFQRRFRETHERALRIGVLTCIRDLVTASERWPSLHVKKPAQVDATRRVRMARINHGDRLIFEGPLRSDADTRPVLLIHDFCKHDEISRVVKWVLETELVERDFVPWLASDEAWDKAPSMDSLPSRLTAFCRPLPERWLSLPDEANLDDEDLRLLVHPTRIQWEALASPRPLLISGSAGCGKTTILCLRLLWSIRHSREHNQPRRLLYVSSNHRLVEQARRQVNRYLEAYGEKPTDGEVLFVSLQDLWRRYLPAPDAFLPEHRLSFGKFKIRYDKYRRGVRHARGIPAEWAWHLIRTIMKGACLPVFDDEGRVDLAKRPPLSQERYMELARARKEVSPEEYQKVYQIGIWYQESVIVAGPRKGAIAGGRMWDDQDLAWEALRHIQEKASRGCLERFDEVFVDEAQDLTELEFQALVSLCSTSYPAGREGVAVTFAGDPLQTMMPSSFQWSLAGNLVYKLHGRPIQQHVLLETWRCDERIWSSAPSGLSLANF